MEGNSLINLEEYRRLFPDRLRAESLRPNQAISAYNLIQDSSEKAIVLNGMISNVTILEGSEVYIASLEYFDSNGYISESSIKEILMIGDNGEFARRLNSITVDNHDLGTITLGCVGFFRDSFDDFLDDVFIENEELSLV